MPAKKSRKPSRSHRSTSSFQKTEIVINVYDLLPPGRLASTLWFLGMSVLHSGVVVNGKEYAYGGHDGRGVTGVYWTKPKTEPPGGTFRCEILQGFTVAPQNEIDAIIRDVSDEFLGTAYNLLTKNCNHFTSHLCRRLTGRSGPGWLNRAASIGVALPCVVPQDWIEPPDYDNADGELLDEDSREDERSRMLRRSSEQPHLLGQQGGNSGSNWDGEEERRRDGVGKVKGKDKGKGKGKEPVRDSSGRNLPRAERVPASS